MFNPANTSEAAALAFYKKFRGAPNFMTPHMIGTYELDKYWVEISYGPHIVFDGRYNYLHGVTVLDKDTLEHRTDLCKSFRSFEEAVEYVRDILDNDDEDEDDNDAQDECHQSQDD